MKLFIYIVMMLFAKVSLAQKDSVDVFIGTETGAQFPGGLVAQTKFISDNFIYPTIAKENGIVGTCYVSFEIDTIGHINKIKIVKGVPNCPECDEEAKRLISIMPNWIPAILNKRPQVCRINYPVKFIMK